MQTLPAIPVAKMEIQSFRVASIPARKEKQANITGEKRPAPDKHQSVIPYYPPVQLPPPAENYLKASDSNCW